MRAFLLCFALLLVRCGERLWRADVWGEDALFLGDALTQGISSLTIPFAGSFHTLQRFIAWLVVKIVPVSAWPITIALLCLAMLAFVASRFADPRYRWLVAHDKVRLTLCALFVFTPGLNEMAGNLCNLNWILLFGGTLILLKPVEEDLTPRELIALLVVLISIGTAFTYLPLLLWRMLARKRLGQRILGESAVLADTVIYHAALFLFSAKMAGWGDVYFPPEGSAVPLPGEFLRLAPLAYMKTILRGIVLRPWIGSGLTTSLLDRGQSLWVVCGVAIATFGLMTVWLRKELRWISSRAIFVFVLGVSLWPLPTIIARPGSLSTFLNGEYWHYRYAFPTGVAALFLWMGCLREKRWLAGFLVLSFVHALDRFPIRAYDLNYHHISESWSTRAEPLKVFLKTGVPGKVAVPTYPAGWQIIAVR